MSRYVGNILDRFFPGGVEVRSGSQRYPDADDWVRIPRGGYAGTTLHVTFPTVLPAGVYYLQVIFTRNLIAPRPGETGLLASLGDQTELLRSNWVKITVEDGDPDRASPPADLK